ncbi:MAG: type II toxin-antitoxin system PemK/MazF family toxin [Candidatus Xenobia bacterium]
MTGPTTIGGRFHNCRYSKQLRALARSPRLPEAGDIVVVDFPGATGTKRRPAVVLSTTVYHANRPDVILGLLTTQVANATSPTDYILQDWSQAGLHQPSAFRSYVVTIPASAVRRSGRLSDRDSEGVRNAFATAVAVD